jgi:hypothetical protein
LNLDPPNKRQKGRTLGHIFCILIKNKSQEKRNRGISKGNAAFKKKILFSNKLDLNLRTKLVKYIWSITWYGAETWTLRKADQKYLDSFEMWCWRRMEMINLTDRVRSEEV